MTDSPSVHIPRLQDSRFFLEEFGKDLDFFHLFLRLVNTYCPIKRVDLVWAEEGPARRVGMRQGTLCTDVALANQGDRLLHPEYQFDPEFCNLVNDYGRLKPETCAISDKAAQQLVRKTGKSQVYQCHAGLIDIAVPVFSDRQHIATLMTGQVLVNPPQRQAFAKIRKMVSHFKHIDLAKLEQAYWQVPVVSDEEIKSTVELLEVFAEYLGTTWNRLSHAIKEEQRRSRELQLLRKEYAHLVLEGLPADQPLLHEIMGKIGLRRPPNRVLVVKLESEEECSSFHFSFDVALTKALQAAEELCDQQKNVSCAYLRKRGICIFFSDLEERREQSSDFKAYALANKVFSAIASQSGLPVRIGIGRTASNSDHLADSYHEACLALESSSDPISAFIGFSSSLSDLSDAVNEIVRHFDDQNLAEARKKLLTLPLQVDRLIGDLPDNYGAQRDFFSSALDSIGLAARRATPEGEEIARLRLAAEKSWDLAGTIFELQEIFLQTAEAILEEVRQMYSGRREKLIERVRRKIRQDLSNPASTQSITIQGIASTLGISDGHLGRIFKESTGCTLERYLMIARVELAKKILLDPIKTISEVADRCGFSDVAYFTRVFRKITGTSPRDYRKNPFLHKAPPACE